MFRRPLLVLLFLLLPGFLAAEGLTVVVERADGASAAFASVKAEALVGEFRVSARADADGRASLGDLPVGRYLVSARLGDLSAEPVEIEIRNGAGSPVGLTLRFAAVRETVVVSAALAPRSEREAGTPVDVLTAEALSSRDEWMLVDGLRGVPGILIRQDGGPGHLAHLQIRGLPGSATAVVVDGAPLRDPAAIQGDSATLLPSLGMLGVERVEIRRGGGSTLYGTNGMGGVLHIVTRSEAAPETLRFAAGLGSAGHSTVAGAFGVSAPGGGVSLGLGRVGVTTGADGDDPWANLSGVARAGFRVGSGARVSLRAFASDASVGLNESAIPLGAGGPGIEAASPVSEDAIRRYEEGAPLASLDLGAANFLPSANDPDALQETRFFSLLARVGMTGRNGSWTLRLHQLETRRRNEDGPGGPALFDPPELQAITYDGGISSAAARVERLFGNHRLLLGGEVERESATTGDPAFTTDLRQTSAAAFVQAETRAAEGRISLRGSLRAQGFRTGEPDLEPAEGSPWSGTLPPPDGGAITAEASASIAVSGGLRLLGSAGRGFRAPSLYERFGTHFSQFGYSVFGDPRLEPEFTSSLDAGFAAASADGRIEARGSFFRSVRRQIIGFGSFEAGADLFGRFGGYENTDGGIARGAEGAVRVALPGRTRAQLQYTLTDADPPGNAPPVLTAAWLVPRHQSGALLSGTLSDRLSWSADLHLASEIHAPLFDPATFATRVFRFAGRRRFDVAVSYEIAAGLTLRAAVHDALDDGAYQSAGFRSLGRVVRANLVWQPR